MKNIPLMLISVLALTACHAQGNYSGNGTAYHRYDNGYYSDPVSACPPGLAKQGRCGGGAAIKCPPGHAKKGWC